jgi:hypothetical protein
MSWLTRLRSAADEAGRRADAVDGAMRRAQDGMEAFTERVVERLVDDAEESARMMGVAPAPAPPPPPSAAATAESDRNVADFAKNAPATRK